MYSGHIALRPDKIWVKWFQSICEISSQMWKFPSHCLIKQLILLRINFIRLLSFGGNFHIFGWKSAELRGTISPKFWPKNQFLGRCECHEVPKPKLREFYFDSFNIAV